MASELIWGIGFAAVAAVIIFFFVRSVIRAAKGDCGCGCGGSCSNCAACKKK